MNNRTNFHTRSGAARVFSWVLALALVLSLAAAPAVTASADAGTYSAEVVFSANGVDISGKLALDTNQVLLGVLAAMTSEGQTLLDAAGYLGPQALAVDSMLLGGAFGIDLATIAQNLPGSIFDPASGSAYALEQDVFDQIMGLLNGEFSQNLQNNQDVTVDSDALMESINVLAEAYSDIPQEIMGMMTIESSNASVVVNGKPIQVEQVRCTADAETSVAITAALIAPLQNNAQAQEALAVVIDEIAAASQQDLGITGAELVQVIVSELPQQLPEAKEELAAEQFLVTSSVCISSATQMPVKFSLELQDADENVVISLLMSEGLDFFRLEVTEGSQTVSALQFEIQENSDSAFVCEFAVIEGDTEDASLRFELNKAGKAFLLSATQGGETHSMSGFYTLSDTLFSVTVDKLDGQEFGGTITLNLRSDDAIALPSFTEVTKMSEEEFTALVQTAMEAAESLSQMFG